MHARQPPTPWTPTGWPTSPTGPAPVPTWTSSRPSSSHATPPPKPSSPRTRCGSPPWTCWWPPAAFPERRPLLVAERVDGVQAAGLLRRVEAEGHAHQRAENDCHQYDVRPEEHRPVEERRHPAGGEDAGRDAQHAAEGGQGDGLDEELHQAVHAPSANGHARPNLA